MELPTPDFIEPSDVTNFDSEHYKKLDLDSEQKGELSMLFSQLPTMLASDVMANTYALRIPAGVSGTLMHYKSGGFGTAIMGKNGIQAHAALYPLETQAMLLQTFSVMSIATGQYFLAQINEEFNLINQKIDQIMTFLYGDKKAELIAEISFAKYAQKNFKSIMSHDTQRIATISSLQASKKIAMKDIEFYMSDLTNKASTKAKSYQEFQEISDEILQIRQSLELAMQLYVSSSILEIYLSENTDMDYLNAVKDDVIYYLNKCNIRILSVFSKLNGRNGDFKAKLFEKFDSTILDQKFDTIIEQLSSGKQSPMHIAIEEAVKQAGSEKKYYLTKDSNVYLKIV